MKKAKKVWLIIITAIVLIIAGYVTYIAVHFYMYDGYKKYITKDNKNEKGTKFQALTDSDPKVDGMVLVAENDYLKLYTNTKTTEVAIYDKRSGEITYSNPVDRANDAIANGTNKTDLNSQFVLTYYDSSLTQATMYNADYSVEREQYKIENIGDGIRYTYLCGNLESATGIIPIYITEKRLNEILSKLGKLDAMRIKGSYIQSSKVSGFLELTEGSQASKIGVARMIKSFEKAGYTQKDYEADMAAAAGGEVPQKTTFTVPLEYKLVDDKLVVTVPVEKIKETGNGKLGAITLLSYFGAGSSTENGYLFVPNGSGSLINFNNGKQASERYNQYIYGSDPPGASYYAIDDTEKARMPVYGIKHEKEAVFAEITSGDTLANLIAEVSGTTNTYNYVSPTFELRGAFKVSILGVEGNAADMPTLEKNMYDTDLQVTYAFLPNEKANYSGMANYYRDELIKKGKLAQKKDEDSLPFYLDIVGGVKKEKSILGVPYLATYPMTTFDEAGEITDKFVDNKISNLRVNYLGWFNGGYYHDTIKNVKVDRVLGGKKDLNALNKKLTDEGAKLYGDVAVQDVSIKADHFDYKMESARRYSGFPVAYGRVNPATLRATSGLGYRESVYYIISPKFLGRYVTDFVKAAKKVELSGISLRDLGDTIASDKRRTEIINREQAKQIVEAQLKALKDSRDNLMVSGGNSYSWAYSTDLTNIPASDNNFYLIDQEIPFYQMVIHGCVDYTSGAVNLTDSYDKQDIILDMIEAGEAPHFTFSYQDSSELKYSGLNNLYSTNYTTWFDDAVNIYNKTNEALKNVVNSKIIDHSVLSSGVTKVTYDNGVIIYINRNNKDITADNINVPAKSYIMEGVK